jgi:Ca2+-binding RTX toxin-like protein
MTDVTYLTKTELPDAFKTSNLNPSLQQAIIDQLIAGGLYTGGPDDGHAVWVESDIHNGPTNPLFDSDGIPVVPGFVSVLEVEGNNVTVQTDSTLKVIVDDGKASGANVNTLNVIGGANSELIVLGNSKTVVNLLDHGNDTVLGGGGNDTMFANDGNDSLVAGAGDDKLVGGSGHDTLVGGSGHDTLIAGAGQHSWLQAGTGNTVITDLSSGGTDTLVAGSGKDTITGQQGDFFTTMGASGNDVYNIYNGSGSSTINLGAGHDTVNFYSTAGNDTINNAGGVDTIDFTHSATTHLTDVSGISAGPQSGEFLIKFSDGQQVLMNGHADPLNQDAFVLKFTDGTLHLKGGS